MFFEQGRLYDAGGAVIAVLLLVGLVIVAVGEKKKEIKSKYQQVVETEREQTPNYTDKELIGKYYEVEAETKNYSDALQGRYVVTKIGSSYFSAPSGGLKSYEIRKRLEALRKIRAIYKAEMYSRGLEIPK